MNNVLGKRPGESDFTEDVDVKLAHRGPGLLYRS
jgi:hypothetical protein